MEVEMQRFSGDLVCGGRRQKGSGHAGIKELHKKEAGQLNSK